MKDNILRQRISQKEKDSKDSQWYKDHVLHYSSKAFTMVDSRTGGSRAKNMRVNYDLYNNILNMDDFNYVINPYGASNSEFEFPANLTNRDIISGKINVKLGLEYKRDFNWRIAAINPEATTRKESVRFDLNRQFVVQQIMAPIRQQIEQVKAQQQQGAQLSPEEENLLLQQIEEEVQTMTPPEVHKYMARTYMDPAEMLMVQLYNYVLRKEDCVNKFNLGWKHAQITAEEIFWVGIENGEPKVRVINPLGFDFDRNPSNLFIEDGNWACYEEWKSLSDLLVMFDFTDDEIDELEDINNKGLHHYMDEVLHDWNSTSEISQYSGIRVRHFVWKSLGKIGFLTYYNTQTGEIEEDIVYEGYKLNKLAGDISIEWKWVPEVHEAWQIGTDIFKNCRPVPGQHKDIDNLYNCKLPYKGAVHSALNSTPVSSVDRAKPYAYLYNIIAYRLEAAIASDRGKKLLLNYNLIPASQGIDLTKWLYYFDALGIGFMNPSEEGNRDGQSDVVNAAKEIDMSMAADIQKYINLLDYLEIRCGMAIGIPKEMEGQIGPNDAVTNTKQIITQSSHILEPEFNLHDLVKRNVMESLLEMTKIAYSQSSKKKLAHILDDLSLNIITIDPELLDNNTYGFFLENTTKASEVKNTISQLAHAALQTQSIDASTVIKIMNSDGVQDSAELLAEGERMKAEQMQKQQESQQRLQMEAEEKAREFQREQWNHEKEMIILKEEERRKTEIQKQTILTLGFNEDKDIDKDGMPDALEVAKFGVDAEIKARKLDLEERKLEHQIKNDSEKNKIAAQKAIQKKVSNN